VDPLLLLHDAPEGSVASKSEQGKKETVIGDYVQIYPISWFQEFASSLVYLNTWIVNRNGAEEPSRDEYNQVSRTTYPKSITST